MPRSNRSRESRTPGTADLEVRKGSSAEIRIRSLILKYGLAVETEDPPEGARRAVVTIRGQGVPALKSLLHRLA